MTSLRGEGNLMSSKKVLLAGSIRRKTMVTPQYEARASGGHRYFCEEKEELRCATAINK
jgi:hypothetical protein